MGNTQLLQTRDEALTDRRKHCLTTLGQYSGSLLQRGAFRRQLFLCLLDVEIKTVQAVDLFGQLVPQTNQFFDFLCAELMEQTVQVVHTLFDPSKALRVHFYAAGHPFGFLRDILQLDTGALEAFLQVRCGFVQAACTDGVQRTTLLAVECCYRRLQRHADLFGMAQAVLLLLQFVQLTRLQIGFLQFRFVQEFIPILNIIRILLTLLGQILQLTQGLYGRGIGLIVRTIVRPQGFVLRDGIHDLQLKICVLDEQIRMLRVDIDEFGSQHFEFLQRHHTVVHERTTLAVGV